MLLSRTYLLLVLSILTLSYTTQGKAIDSLQQVLRQANQENFPAIIHAINEEMFRQRMPALACAQEVEENHLILQSKGFTAPHLSPFVRLGWLRAQMTYATSKAWHRSTSIADSITQLYTLFKNQKFDLGIAESASILTFYYKHKGKFDTSLAYALEASDIYERLNYRKDAAYLYSQIALEHYLAGNLKLSQFYMDKAIDIGLESLPPRIHISAINTLGLIHEKQLQYDSAKQYFTQATALACHYGDSVWIGISLGNIGDIYFQEGNYKTAKRYLLEDLRYSKKYEEWQNVVITLNRLGDTYKKQGEWNEARRYYFEAYRIVKEGPFGVHPPRTLYMTYNNLSEAYASLSQPKEAYKYAREALFWNDSLLRRNLSATIDKIQQKHEWDKQRQIQESHEQAQEKIIKAEKAENLALIVGCAGLALLFAVAVFFIHKQRKLNSLLQKNNQEIVEQKSYIEAQKEELEQQQHEISNQNKAITKSNTLLQESNQALKKEEQFLKDLLQDLMQGSEEIEMKNKELTAEVKHRAHELVAKSEELARLNQQLEGFAYVTAHNIRGPIARLKGLMNIFDHSEINQENRQVWQMLVDNTEEVDQIIHDLSTMLEVRTHVHESLRTFSLEKALQKTITSLKAAIEESDAQLNINLHVEDIFGIPSYIENIFYQLLSNAIKFRDPTVPLAIHIEAHKSEEYYVVITIRDNGLGLDTERHKEHLFGMYKRFHLHTKGKGMGLHLAKIQVENLHGSIHLESSPNNGATFYIKLPLDAKHHVIH